MKKSFLLTIITVFFCKNILATPIFYFTSKDGLYTLDNGTAEVSKLAVGTHFTSIALYGNNQLLVNDYGSGNGGPINIYNLDGTLDKYYLPKKISSGAIEHPDKSGNILYSDYFNSQAWSYDISNDIQTMLGDVSDSRSKGIEARSTGEVYLTKGYIKDISNNSLIYGNGASWVSMDSSDNFYASSHWDNINKIDADDNIILDWWKDTNVRLYNFNYDAADSLFYGIGFVKSLSQYNMYQFTQNGAASVCLSNLIGFDSSGGSHDLVIINDGQASTTIPEPSSIFIFSSILFGMILRQKLK